MSSARPPRPRSIISSGMVLLADRVPTHMGMSGLVVKRRWCDGRLRNPPAHVQPGRTQQGTSACWMLLPPCGMRVVKSPPPAPVRQPSATSKQPLAAGPHSVCSGRRRLVLPAPPAAAARCCGVPASRSGLPPAGGFRTCYRRKVWSPERRVLVCLWGVLMMGSKCPRRAGWGVLDRRWGCRRSSSGARWHSLTAAGTLTGPAAAAGLSSCQGERGNSQQPSQGGPANETTNNQRNHQSELGCLRHSTAAAGTRSQTCGVAA